jgi:hypothetical protein
LTKRCLVDFEEDENGARFSIHRSLQLALRRKLNDEPSLRTEAYGHALSIVRRASPYASKFQVPDSKQWPRFRRSNPHALSLCNAYIDADPPLAPSEALARVFYDAGFHHWETWTPILRHGTLMLDTAEKILDELAIDQDARLRADIACIWAFLVDYDLSRRGESLQRRVKIRDTRAKILKRTMQDENATAQTKVDDEKMYYNAVNDLGLSHLQHDNFREAGVVFDECYIKYQKWGTVDTEPFEFGKYYHNMAFVRVYEGKFDDAVTLIDQGIALKLQTFGLDNSRYWWWQYDRACIDLQAGKLDAALQRHLEILDNRRRICGSSDDATLQSLYSVGAVHHHMNNFVDAEYGSSKKANVETPMTLTRLQDIFARMHQVRQGDTPVARWCARSNQTSARPNTEITQQRC